MKEARVVGVCKAKKRGVSKKNINSGLLQKDWGIVGDAHAGTNKQVSLLAREDIENAGITASPGDFAENITTGGIDLQALKIGDELQIGEAVVSITRFGKTREEMIGHSFSYQGTALLPTKGVFAKVVKGGEVKVGDRICRY
ncbi:MOSC domain-containing protein [Patescibacteria group bacterium]|nr:MOSC domain-containing protein [Patescibacteria group bacterium]